MAGGWDFTIDDSSAYISYYPAEDSGRGNTTSHGWNPYYSGSGGLLNSSSPFGSWASGQSLHITSLDGASLGFEFYGSAVCLYGSSNGTYDVSLDSDLVNNVTAPGDGTLYCRDGLPSDVHYVNLTAHFPHDGQLLEFDYATVTYEFSTGTTTPPEVVVNNTDASSIHYQGDWELQTIANAPSTSLTAPLHLTTSYGSSATLNFSGEAIAVYGFRVYGNWLYNVTLDGEQRQYNGSTIWELTNSLLYFRAGLDPTTSHTLELVNEGPESFFKFYLNTISVYGTQELSAAVPSDHHSNKAAIVGGVLGSLLGLAFIAGIAIVFVFRRRLTSTLAPQNHVSPYDIDTESNARPHIESGVQRRNLSEKPSHAAGTAVIAQIPHSYTDSTVLQSQTSATEDNIDNGAASPVIDVPTDIPEAGANANAASPPSAQPVLVDRIIELIAQRIDRRPDRAADDGSEAPPDYPDSAV